MLGHGFVSAALFAAAGANLGKVWILHRLGRPARRTLRMTFWLTACGGAIMLTINVNNHLAQARAESLVVAIDHYRAVAGRYPRTLGDLVPAYLDHVPRAKYTLSYAHFDYANSAGRVTLTYPYAPPFGRARYDFDTARWTRR